MKFTIRTLIWASILVALIIAGIFGLMPKPVDVEVADIIEGPLRVSVQEDGKTRIREKFIVSTPVAGRLSRIDLHAGDSCDEGTLLAVILPGDPAILDARARAEAEARVQASGAALQRADANIEQLKVTHDLNKTKVERAKRLMSSNGISRNEYDIAKAEYLASAQAVKTANFDSDIAKFELEMARAAVSQFRNDGENGVGEDSGGEGGEQTSADPFEIHAPVSGKVLRVFQESSTVVNAGMSLLELGDTKNLEIEIDVLSTDAVRIRPGAELTIEHWGGDSPLQGNVRVIEPAAFTKISSLGVEEQRVNIIADFSETPERIATLGDGYRVEARITVDEIPNATLVPNSALFRHHREWHVLKVKNDAAFLQPVETGLRNESHTQIIKGISSGDKVIVYPSDEVKSGTKVRF